MKRLKKLIHATGILFLLVAMMLSINAVAVEDMTQSKAELRQEDLDFLYAHLKNQHPNLYANTSEETFLAKKAEIESRLSTEPNSDFVLDLQSMAALVHDSHTNVAIGSIATDSGFYPFALSWMDGQWILSSIETTHQNLLGAEITALNGLSMDDVIAKFSTFISADNPIKLRRAYRQMCNVEALYQATGIVSNDTALTLSLRDSSGQTQELSLTSTDYESQATLSIASLQTERTGTPVTSAQKDKHYFSIPLDEDTYYIQYNRCQEDPNLPMETFCSQVKADLTAGNYQQILVDLRYNGGGSDGVIFPLLLLLRQEMDTQGVQVVGLIGESTFSSAIINAVELQEMGAVLAGEPTSGSVNHFGAVAGFRLPNSSIKVGVSSKFIALNDYFDAASGKGVEPLVPDVEIPQTVADYLAGQDICVNQLVANPSNLQPAPQDDAPLTRARFVGTLYEAIGSPKQAMNALPFQDVFGFEWYLPALHWAANEQVALGTGNHLFSGTKPLTWQEAALFLVRTADAMGIQPQERNTDQLPEALLEDAWNREAVEQAWEWGLLPQNVDFSVTPTRAQGEQMANALMELDN